MKKQPYLTKPFKIYTNKFDGSLVVLRDGLCLELAGCTQSIKQKLEAHRIAEGVINV